MKSVSRQSSRKDILSAIVSCRAQTLDLFNEIDSKTFCQQAHPDFSPVGWHLGHIAFTEEYWILAKLAGLPPQFPEYHRLFAADGLPKTERQNLPPLEDIQNYLNVIRIQVLNYLKIAPLDHQERLWRWLIQHESQHSETITFVLQLLRRDSNGLYTQLNLPHSPLPITHSPLPEMVKIPAGEFVMGNEAIEAQDNERPLHRCYLPTYWIDAYPVTCAQYREFMSAGGYQKREFWSEQGWKWLQDNPVSHPLYWVDSPDWESHPVCGVSWYEAEAYANYAGKRLPTEAEWEKAASMEANLHSLRVYPWGNSEPNPKLCNFDGIVGHTTPVNAYRAGRSALGCYDMLGNVWEWTASWFEGYPGFEPYPYGGYSQSYFDRQHRVMRGGSWATRRWGLRNSFRNWYHPAVRQILVGFRCVR